MLPANALRPTEDHWQKAWGDRPIPAGFGNLALELGQLLELEQLGACLLSLPPDHRAGPLHWHQHEEELFFVLSGELVARELWPDAERYREYPLAAGELVAYPPGTRIAHQSHNRGGAVATYLALSHRWNDHEIAVYPDSGKTQLRGLGKLGVFGSELPAAEHIAAARRVADAREVVALKERPAWCAGPSVAERALPGGAFGRPLARAAGATSVFASVDRFGPGAHASPLHWHTADEELALVLEGAPVLRQVTDGVESRTELQAGDAVCWKAGAQTAHQLLGPDSGDAKVLVVGTCRIDDVTVFPERGTVYARALDRAGRLDPAGYFDGEG